MKRRNKTNRKHRAEKPKWLFYVLGEGILLMINWICYQDIWWMLPEQVLLFPYITVWKARQRKREKQECEKGFREFLQSMMTSLQAGYSLENACRAGLRELEVLYQGKKNPVLIHLRKIVRGLELNVPLEVLFLKFAEESDLEEVFQFAAILEIVRESGGNMVEILKRSLEQMKRKMDTEQEIQVMLSGKIFEKNIMLLMPFGILLYLRLANPEYIRCFYQTLAGHLLMSLVIAVTILCFFWSEKIMEVDF